MLAIPSGSGCRAASSAVPWSARKRRTSARKLSYSALYARFTRTAYQLKARGDKWNLPRSVEQGAGDEAHGRHRRVQQVAQHVDENPAHGDITAEAFEEIGAVAQALDHRIELILSRDVVHDRLIAPARAP